MQQILENAVSHDLEEILELYKDLNPEEDINLLSAYLPIWEQILDPALPMDCMVIRLEGRIVASAVLTILPNLSRRGRPYGIIENVIVSPQYRRQGLGAQLMEEAKRRCRDKNCYKLMFLSSATRTDAHQFYQKLGFDGSSKRGFQIRWK